MHTFSIFSSFTQHIYIHSESRIKIKKNRYNHLLQTC